MHLSWASNNPHNVRKSQTPVLESSSTSETGKKVTVCLGTQSVPPFFEVSKPYLFYYSSML